VQTMRKHSNYLLTNQHDASLFTLRHPKSWMKIKK